MKKLMLGWRSFTIYQYESKVDLLSVKREKQHASVGKLTAGRDPSTYLR